MYLRYGDLSWDSAEKSEENPSPPNAAGEGHKPAGGAARRPSNGHLPMVRLSGVELHAITEAGCIKYILDELDRGHGGVVVTPNLDHLRRCMHDIRFGALVAEADLVVADGMPLVWASRLQGTPLPERVAGSDLVSSLSAAAAERGRSVFLLGGAEKTAEGAAKILLERHPNLSIVGIYSPPVGFEENNGEMSKIVQMLTHTDPDIVYVALGSPKQEMLIERLRKTLPNAWWLGVGNSFSFLCGYVRRAPLWMQKRGLEWVHRLVQEPQRLFHRYIVAGLPFAASLLGKSILKGLPRRIKGQPPVPATFRSRPMGSLSASPIQANGNGHAAIESFSTGIEPARPSPPGGNGSGGNGNGHLMEHAPVPPAASVANHRLNGLTGPPSAASRLQRIRALVLLGGMVRPTPLVTTIGRSVLDLPLDEGGTILDHWLHHAQEMAQLAAMEHLPVRVLVDRNSLEPAPDPDRHERMLRIERDASEYRGTGGVLGDLSADYGPDDLILVCNANQVLLEPLTALAGALDRRGADVSLVAHYDGTPSGMMLIRCEALRLIPRSGFVDMKEQGLAHIASHFDVAVMNRRRPTGLPVRSLADYIAALRLYHRRRGGKATGMDLLAEDWRPTFAIIEEGAVVDPTARIHDSVVLRGACVESGAVLVRSIICPGGTVKRERTAVDQFITPASQKLRSMARNTA